MCVPAILLGLGPFSKIFALLSSSKDGNIIQKKKAYTISETAETDNNWKTSTPFHGGIPNKGM